MDTVKVRQIIKTAILWVFTWILTYSLLRLTYPVLTDGYGSTSPTFFWGSVPVREADYAWPYHVAAGILAFLVCFVSPWISGIRPFNHPVLMRLYRIAGFLLMLAAAGICFVLAWRLYGGPEIWMAVLIAVAGATAMLSIRSALSRPLFCKLVCISWVLIIVVAVISDLGIALRWWRGMVIFSTHSELGGLHRFAHATIPVAVVSSLSAFWGSGPTK